MNRKVVTLVRRWQAEGSPQQEGFEWGSNKKNWIDAFPRHKSFILGLPEEIDRVTIRSICQNDNYHIRERFLGVMIWGYGDRGYGPYRVTQMLSQMNSDAVLSKVYEFCQYGEPKNAYEYLRNNRIRILGPSFSSKFICFCTPREVGAPIYDSLISRWIETYAKKDFSGVPTTSSTWNLRTYTKYWEWVRNHAEELNCFPDEIELVLFRDAERRFSKQ